jgi:hypothetical protein
MMGEKEKKSILAPVFHYSNIPLFHTIVDMLFFMVDSFVDLTKI